MTSAGWWRGADLVMVCLQEHTHVLEQECRQRVLTLGILQSRDVRLDPILYSACTAEMSYFCRDVVPGAQLISRGRNREKRSRLFQMPDVPRAFASSSASGNSSFTSTEREGPGLAMYTSVNLWLQRSRVMWMRC